MATEILLTRHGKTVANLDNRFAGRSDEPLHRQGEEQLAEVAARLIDRDLAAIFSGPLPRTTQSAEIIGKATGVPIYSREAFNEIDIPHWDGLTKQEITDRFGRQYPTWLSAPHDFRVEGCETLALVQSRAVDEIEGIFEQHEGKTVIVVSHLIVIRCLVLHYRHQPINDFRSIKIDNASLSILSRDAKSQTSVSLDI